MLAIVLFMFVTLALCAVVAGMVVVGMQGRGRTRAPRIAKTMSRAARHLNGDAEPPRAFRRWIAQLPAFR